LRASGEADRDIRDDGSGRGDLVADDRDLSCEAGVLDPIRPAGDPTGPPRGRL